MDALGVSEGELVYFKWKGFNPKPVFSMKHSLNIWTCFETYAFFTKGFLKGHLVPVHFCLQCKRFNP